MKVTSFNHDNNPKKGEGRGKGTPSWSPIVEVAGGGGSP